MCVCACVRACMRAACVHALNIHSCVNMCIHISVYPNTYVHCGACTHVPYALTKEVLYEWFRDRVGLPVAFSLIIVERAHEDHTIGLQHG